MIDEIEEQEPQILPLFKARNRRAEIDGHVYERGDITTLEGLTAEEKAYAIHAGHYVVLNFQALDDDILAELEKLSGN